VTFLQLTGRMVSLRGLGGCFTSFPNLSEQFFRTSSESAFIPPYRETVSIQDFPERRCFPHLCLLRVPTSIFGVSKLHRPPVFQQSSPFDKTTPPSRCDRLHCRRHPQGSENFPRCRPSLFLPLHVDDLNPSRSESSLFIYRASLLTVSYAHRSLPESLQGEIAVYLPFSNGELFCPPPPAKSRIFLVPLR